MKRRIYTDTSVIGGCLDEEFSEGSIALFDCFRSGSEFMVLSSLTLAELEAAPGKVQAVIKSVPTEFIDYIEFTQDASALAEVYLTEGVVTSGYNSVNLRLGYPLLEIRTPIEVLQYED